jgi:hypothetical protein
MKIFEKFKWTDKPEFKREHALLCTIIGVLVIGFFKLRPYFQESSNVIAHTEHSEQSKAPKSLLEKLGLTGESKNQAREVHAISGGRSFGGSSQGTTSSQKAIIERPLFDGLEVILKGTLLNSISSLASENPAEIRVSGFIPTELTQGMNDSEIVGAQLKGIVTANNNKRILNISFTQITTNEGRTFPASGYAIDLAHKTLGIAAEYSSGLPRRLLGAVLDRAIVAGDQIGMSALITGGAGNSIAQINQQATNEISEEATKDLRETQEELSVPAGTIIAVKIRIQQGGSQ